MGGVSVNVTVLRPAAVSTVSEATSMLERTRYRSGTTTVIRNTALRAGSSKHGNARRASVGSNWVHAQLQGMQGDVSHRPPNQHVHGDRAGKLPAVWLDSQQQLITRRHDRHGQAPVNERRHGGSPGLLLDVPH